MLAHRRGVGNSNDRKKRLVFFLFHDSRPRRRDSKIALSLESISGLLKSLTIRAQHTGCRLVPILIVAKVFKFYYKKNKTNVLLTFKPSEPSANRFETFERLSYSYENDLPHNNTEIHACFCLLTII